MPAFFCLATTDGPPQSPHPMSTAHSPHKGGLTFPGIAKTLLKIRLLRGNSESAKGRGERKSWCSLPPLVDSLPVLPAIQTAQALRAPTLSSQSATASSEGTGITSSAPPLASPVFCSSSSPPRSPKHKRCHTESSSGQIPLSHPGLAEHASQRRESIELVDTYHCAGGVNVPVLLRSTRSELIDIASFLGANALVDEQYVSGPLRIFSQLSNSTRGGNALFPALEAKINLGTRSR